MMRHTATSRRRSRAATLFLLVAAAAAACSDAPSGPKPEPVVTGQVVSDATGRPVGSAAVSVDSMSTKTDANGRFSLNHVPDGTRTLRVAAAGFEQSESSITVAGGNATRDVRLTRIETFAVDDFALYIPKTVDLAHGLLLALGGPDTRAFATGASAGAPNPDVEASLQMLGQDYRTMATELGLAILGTSRAAMPDGAESDALIDDVVQRIAGASGHPELASTPLLMYGISGGAPEASGYSARMPARVAGLFLKVPASVATPTTEQARKVPAYVVLAELDAFVDNAKLAAAFESNRKAGALWALAIEPGVPHHSLSPAQRELTLKWFQTIAELRLPEPSSVTLRELTESSGWLGDPATGLAWAWASYPGNRAVASWLPSAFTAAQWQGMQPNSGGPLLVGDVYDMAVTVTYSDLGDWGPAQGTIYEAGTRWLATLEIQQAPNSADFTGVFRDLRYLTPDSVTRTADPAWDHGTLKGSVSPGGAVTISLWRAGEGDPSQQEPYWRVKGALSSRDIFGTFMETWIPGDFSPGALSASGDFIAKRK